MLAIREYVKAESLAQAYELNQKRANRIIGGMLWMKMSSAQIHTAIDLSGLGLDKIEETEGEFRIGCMVTLRQMELHEGLERWSGGILRGSVEGIVGVQFRNLATVGGSLFGRFGFSDVLTAFLALDAYVELYQGGTIPIHEFSEKKRDNDILVRVIVKKRPGEYVYLSHRNTKTDFPVLTLAMSVCDDKLRVAAGARPQKAILIPDCEDYAGKSGYVRGEEELEILAEEIAGRIPVESNIRASAQYRRHLAKVLLKRGLAELETRLTERRQQDAD